MAAFTWENFDNSFLKKIIYSPETPVNVRPIFPTEEKEDLVCSMNLICDYPDKSFVVRYRDVIEENLFHNYSDIFKEVCSTVGINMYDSINALYTLRLKPLTVSLISAYINALLKTGGCDVMITQSSKFRYTIKLDMAKTPSEDIPLYDYQKDAVSALTEHFVKKDNKKGMLIMPTGSGKSRTASYFLIREMISRGYQVLWIVHRHMLIDQAAECFYRFAGLSKLSDPDIKNYRISCISGEHQSIRAIAKKDNIIIGSIQSLCRNHNHLRRITSPKLFIVIDEAHHTFARSYRETLKYLF
ncbi:MAG: DEAD/DEAH box helicase family protein, partial [Clostridia bacterium]|nr:DEAD/DEAH box helicase family protein [Clostridia bacterium]